MNLLPKSTTNIFKILFFSAINTIIIFTEVLNSEKHYRSHMSDSDSPSNSQCSVDLGERFIRIANTAYNQNQNKSEEEFQSEGSSRCSQRRRCRSAQIFRYQNLFIKRYISDNHQSVTDANVYYGEWFNGNSKSSEAW